MIDLLVFILSLQEGKYLLYIASLHKLIRWYFEYFILQKNDRQFSLMGLDHIHEQNNNVMKGMSGATSSLNKVDESSLARWTLWIHKLASIVSE